MSFNPKIHHKKSIRLNGFDYASEGLYFITICVKDKRCLFGFIENKQMNFTDIGRKANDFWLEIPEHFPHIELLEFVVMPNHMHGIIEIKNPPLATVRIGHVQSLHPIPQPGPGSIPTIIQQYKSAVKRWTNKNERNYFEWQSRFHDHIIRSTEEYCRIADYIEKNPAKWPDDKFYV